MLPQQWCCSWVCMNMPDRHATWQPSLRHTAQAYHCQMPAPPTASFGHLLSFCHSFLTLGRGQMWYILYLESADIKSTKHVQGQFVGDIWWLKCMCFCDSIVFTLHLLPAQGLLVAMLRVCQIGWQSLSFPLFSVDKASTAIDWSIPSWARSCRRLLCMHYSNYHCGPHAPTSLVALHTLLTFRISNSLLTTANPKLLSKVTQH